MLLVSHNVQQRGHEYVGCYVSVFGLEDEFAVFDVQRVDASSVRVVIEQVARDGPCPAYGVITGVVKDRPVMRLKDLPTAGQSVEL